MFSNYLQIIYRKGPEQYLKTSYLVMSEEKGFFMKKWELFTHVLQISSYIYVSGSKMAKLVIS